jgi:translation initiation factor IF-2
VPKVRVYELAREFDLPNKEILDKLTQAGIIVRSHSSSVDEEEARAALKAVVEKKTKAEGPGSPSKKAIKPVLQPEAKKKAERAKAKVSPEKSQRAPAAAGVTLTPVKPAAPAAKELPAKEASRRPSEADRAKAPSPTPTPAPPSVKPASPVAPKAAAVGKVVELRPREEEKAAKIPSAPSAIRISESITVKELSDLFERNPSEVIKKLMKMGIMAAINQTIDTEVAKTIGSRFGYTVEVVPLETGAGVRAGEEAAQLMPRAPVVTIMGHVDHGKTSLLDAIRHTNVIASEYGEITQHIGAYEVELEKGRVVFLDTPGHEAFTAMRARGTQVTDIVVLVVAADDGVMPQTVEAINHAKDAGVPILVAVNKIDKASGDPGRVRQQLSDYGLMPEEWGGQTIYVEISAKKRIGIENLLEMLILQAEILELKANPQAQTKGTIIEARLDRGRGPVATVLVQNGTLRTGDSFLAGFHSGRVRAMLNDKGKRVDSAGPSTPVEVFGFSGVPVAGETFLVVPDEKKARMIALARMQKHREESIAVQPRITLDDLYRQIQEGAVKELRMIIKGDVQGSVEPLQDSLERISTAAVKLKVIHSSVGAITESDVALASASNAIILGFNVKPEVKVQKMATQEGVDIRLYHVIYDAINEVAAAMEGLLEPKYVEKLMGRAEVRNLFSVPRHGMIAGSYVLEGKVVRDAPTRIVREGKSVFEGKIDSLRRFKEDVKEVAAGYECGVGVAGFSDLRVGDLIETYELEKVAQKL